jgi:hypothetical protein
MKWKTNPCGRTWDKIFLTLYKIVKLTENAWCNCALKPSNIHMRSFWVNPTTQGIKV